MNENEWDKSKVKTTQHIKPHMGCIREMLINQSENVLVSLSEDQSIFIYRITKTSNGVQVLPVGFVPVNAAQHQIACIDCEMNEVSTRFFWLRVGLL